MSFCAGKTVMITGANSGIGFETARQLASEAGRIIMVCRSRERGEAAKNIILEEHPEASISLHLSDLSSRASILTLTDEIKREYDSIEVLINNAGGMFYRYDHSDDGLEYTFALNHMGYFRLTKGLLPLLEAGAPSRIIQVSSEAHRASSIRFDSLLDPGTPYRPFIVYGRSKLANILFTRESAVRFAGKGITSVSLHPGFVHTNFGGISDKLLSARVFKQFAQWFAVPPEKGAATPVFLARTDQLTNGGYYSSCRERTPSRNALDTGSAQRLWEISDEIA